MTDLSDKEEQLRRQLLKGTAELATQPPQADIDKALVTAIQRANLQTGGRDLLVLAISSFFAFLMVFCAPWVAASQAKKNTEKP